MKVVNFKIAFFSAILLMFLVFTFGCENQERMLAEKPSQEVSFLKAHNDLITSDNLEKGIPPHLIQYGFTGEGRITSSLKINKESKSLSLRYQGSKNDQKGIDFYFNIGMSDDILPANLSAEIAYLGHQLLIRDKESGKIYNFLVSQKNTPERLISKSGTINKVAFLGIYGSDPDGLEKAGRNRCICSCFSKSPEHNNGQTACGCYPISCDSCYIACDSSHYASCVNRCLEE